MKELIRWLGRTNRRVGAVLLVLTVLLAGVAVAQEAMQPEAAAAGSDVVKAEHLMERVGAFVAAALATGLGSIAAGMAVSNVGSAAMGAVAERPELMGKSLIYVALAEGIAIYGLLISIIILAKV
jgi:V/A-type H+-transporting ATPase subunit K